MLTLTEMSIFIISSMGSMVVSDSHAGLTVQRSKVRFRAPAIFCGVCMFSLSLSLIGSFQKYYFVLLQPFNCRISFGSLSNCFTHLLLSFNWQTDGLGFIDLGNHFSMHPVPEAGKQSQNMMTSPPSPHLPPLLAYTPQCGWHFDGAVLSSSVREIFKLSENFSRQLCEWEPSWTVVKLCECNKT